MNRLLIVCTVTCVLLISSCLHAQFRRESLSPTGEKVSFVHDGKDREYRIHVPAKYDSKIKTPLVLCFHGGGGNADQGSVMGMTSVADENGFIVVYPNAINKHWNDGRESEMYREHDQSIDDVAFAMEIVDRVKKKFNIDEARIFSTGVSNGGFMTQRLAIEHSETFSAVGIVIATMAKPLKEKFDPKLPVSVLYLNGTADPLVPYGGGEVVVELFPKLSKLRKKPQKSRGVCVSTDEAVSMWVKRNKLKGTPETSQLPDEDTEDGCSVELSRWNGGQQGTSVALYKVVGGGHTLPGRPQRIPGHVVGKTNRDIVCFEVVWDFFANHARKPKSKTGEETTKKKAR